jgi:hypothetical protein
VLVLASAVILVSESRATHDYILLSQNRDSPNLEGEVPVLISPGIGWVCCLQLVLVLASAVILVSESRATHDYILLSQNRDPPNLEGEVPVLISPGIGWVCYSPRHWVPFSGASYDSQGYCGGI